MPLLRRPTSQDSGPGLVGALARLTDLRALGVGALNEPGPGSILGFAIRNDRTKDVALQVSPRNFSAVDNRGKKLEIAGINPFYGYWGQGWGGTFVPGSGNTNRLYDDYSNLYVQFDVANPSVTSVVVTATGISSIQNARWRMPNLEH